MSFVLRSTFCLILLAPSAQASGGKDTDLCFEAAETAAHDTGVPARLLRAIALIETQYNGAPWPWTVNAEGTGNWYPTRAEAEAAARSALAQTESVDIGCFQINTRWHSNGFPSMEAMFDPDANARYAANYLLDLHRQTGNWSDAVAAYHSRDPDRGRSYLERVGSVLAAEEKEPPLAESPRRNRFPLLTAGAEGSRGSIVPRLSGHAPLIGGP